jgi:lysyl-tRNA synthetase class 2
MSNEQNTTENTQELSELLQIRRDKLKNLQDEGRDPFEVTKFDVTHKASEIKDNYTEEDRELTKRGSDEVEIIKAKISALDGENVVVAGRIMSKRGMGKVGFIHIVMIV